MRISLIRSFIALSALLLVVNCQTISTVVEQDNNILDFNVNLNAVTSLLNLGLNAKLATENELTSVSTSVKVNSLTQTTADVRVAAEGIDGNVGISAQVFLFDSVNANIGASTTFIGEIIDGTLSTLTTLVQSVVRSFFNTINDVIDLVDIRITSETQIRLYVKLLQNLNNVNVNLTVDVVLLDGTVINLDSEILNISGNRGDFVSVVLDLNLNDLDIENLEIGVNAFVQVSSSIAFDLLAAVRFEGLNNLQSTVTNLLNGNLSQNIFVEDIVELIAVGDIELNDNSLEVDVNLNVAVGSTLRVSVHAVIFSDVTGALFDAVSQVRFSGNLNEVQTAVFDLTNLDLNLNEVNLFVDVVASVQSDLANLNLGLSLDGSEITGTAERLVEFVNGAVAENVNISGSVAVDAQVTIDDVRIRNGEIFVTLSLSANIDAEISLDVKVELLSIANIAVSTDVQNVTFDSQTEVVVFTQIALPLVNTLSLRVSLDNLNVDAAVVVDITDIFSSRLIDL